MHRLWTVDILAQVLAETISLSYGSGALFSHQRFVISRPMAISADQLREVLALAVREAVSQTMAAGATGTQGGTHHSGGWRKQLDYRGGEGLTAYKGGEVEWVDWSWKVKVALGPMSPTLVELMGMAERNVGATTAQLMAMGDPDDLEGRFGGAPQASSEFYSILAKFTEGEAATLVKGSRS